MSYELNVLVNGNKCRQYLYDGKIFIEAKRGSEYTIEIKNNDWQRILAVCSVDGLDILNGKPATENGPGYVITGYSSGKFDGFRVSDEKVAKFVFDYKNASYASSKEDGSERNVGVIGVRLFQEKEKPVPQIKEFHHYQWEDYWWNKPHWPHPKYTWEDYPIAPWRTTCGGLPQGRVSSTGNPPTIWNENLYKDSDTIYEDTITYHNSGTNTLSSENDEKLSPKNACHKSTLNNVVKTTNCCHPKGILRGFDMGTKWGESKESRVIEVEFEKGLLVLSTNIYYASRQSLIEMGVPLGNEKQVSFPEPFADSKYAKPPKDWKG